MLWGIDDGSETLDDALAFATVAAASGTSVLAATPHVREDYPDVVCAQIGPQVSALNRELAERGIDLQVVPGGEVALLEALERPVEELAHVTLGGGDTLLVETPFGPLPSSFDGILSAIARRGFRVLLAHPEISPDLQRDPQRLGRLADQGVLLQITASSLRDRKSHRGKLALEAVRQRWAHVIASDGHSADWRPPLLGEYVGAAQEALPELADELAWMARDVPQALLDAKPLPPRPERREAPRRGLWQRLRG